MKIYGRPNKQAAPSFNQIAKYEIENALPNMAPPWPPTSPNTKSPEANRVTETTDNKIVFAGDYTLNGSIEGALRSGITPATKIIRNRV
jgi:monoamine oxidase